MQTKKQKRLGVIRSKLESIGIVHKDANQLSKLIDNFGIHNLERVFMKERFQKTAEESPVAMRRTYGNNVVIYGPTGYAVIERDEVYYAFNYNNKDQDRKSFDDMTKYYTGAFTVYYNKNLVSLESL